jgi:TolB protein
VNPVHALFSAGWGQDDQAEAFLIIARRTSGDFFWDGMLLAPAGFVKQGPDPQPVSTPTPAADMDVWTTYTNPAYAVSLEYPADWAPVPGYVAADGQPIRYAAINGFFHIGAMDTENIDDAANHEAQHRLQPYGIQPTVESLEVQGQEARLILPSADQAAGMHYQAGLIIRYPDPVNMGGTMVRFFVLWADVAHIRTFGKTLRFLP